jgi:hypothetical protein
MTNFNGEYVRIKKVQHVEDRVELEVLVGWDVSEIVNRAEAARKVRQTIDEVQYLIMELQATETLLKKE